MYAKFFKAAERKRKAQALAEENEARCSPSNPRQMHENGSMQLKKNMPSESYSSCESGSKSSKTEIKNLIKIMENSLHISKPLLGERKLAERHKTGNGEEHMEISPSINSKMAIQTESENKNSMKPLTNGCPGHKVLVDSEVAISVDTTIGTNTHDLTKVMKNSLGGSNSKIESGKMTLMDFRRMKLAQINNESVDANEKGTRKENGRAKQKMGAAKKIQMELIVGNEAESSNMPPVDLSVGEHIFQTEPKHVPSKNTGQHMFSTEGRRTLPDMSTEVIENGIHGTKQKMGATKMVETELGKENLVKSSNMPTMDPSVGEHIFQTEPKPVFSKNTSQHMFSTEGSETLPNSPTDGGSNSKMTLMDFMMKLANMNKVPVNEKGTRKHMLLTEGRKTMPDRPKEVIENRIYGTNMVQKELSKGNLAESLNMPHMDLSVGEHIFQTEPKPVFSKNTSQHMFSTEGIETVPNRSTDGGSNSKMTLMDFSMKLANMKKVSVNEKGTRKHMLSTEGRKTMPDRPKEVIENGTKQKMGAANIVQMELSKGNLAESSNMPPMDLNVGEHIFQTEPKHVPSKNIIQHMFLTEVSETLPNRPTEVMENGIHGAKKKTGTVKMVPVDLCKGNLAESLTIQTEQKYAFIDNRGAEPDYFANYQKCSGLDCRRGEASKLYVPPVVGKFKNKESHMDITKTDVSQYYKERTEFNKLVQKRNPEVREITNTLELPSLFDKLRDSVNDMNYNRKKNPVAVLNELIPDLEYHTEKFGSQHLPNFKVSVNINGQNYCGVGKNKKSAKVNTATAALKGIGTCKRTLTSTRTSIAKNVEPTYISSNWRNDPLTSASRDQERIPPGQTVYPVSALNNLRKGVEYQFVVKNGPPHLPNFEARVRVDQKIYRGTGRSKKLAKANAARQALMSINGETNNSQGASKPRNNTSNVATASANKQYVAVYVPKGKLPFAVLNELYPNPDVSWTGNGSNGSKSFTINLEGRKFTGVGLNMKSAKNNAAITALHELRGFSPTSWENH